MFKIRWRTVAVLAIILGIGLGTFLNHITQISRVKHEMEHYLKKEYGKEFVVTKVRYFYPYFGSSKNVGGIAYPKDDPDLKFEISKSASDTDPNTRRYMEFYLSDFWEKQKSEELRAKLNNDIVWAGISAIYKREELYGRTVDISEAEHLFKDRIDLYVGYGIFLNYKDYRRRFSEFESYTKAKLNDEQNKYIFNIVKKLKDKNYKDIKLEITFFNEQYKAEIKKNPVWYLTQKVSYFESLSAFKKGTILCQFLINDINHIEVPQDIAKHIDEKRCYLHQDE